MSVGYIYIRDNTWYKRENVLKIGISASTKDRNSTYITSEVESGEYIMVIEIPLCKMKILDKVFKYYFKSYNIYKGGGTEFYDRCIIDLIEPYLQKINIEYKVLTNEEITLINRLDRLRNLYNIDKLKNIFNQLNIQNIINHYKNKRLINLANLRIYKNNIIKPNEHQQYILEIIEDFFKLNNIGKIIWACGLGKALLSILIVRLLNFKSIIIGVPSIHLQKQMINEILKIYSSDNILLVGGDKIDGIKSTTNINQIIKVIDTYNKPIFVITTYHSCHLLNNKDINVDFKIGDEAHHLVGIENEEHNGFCLFHKIHSKKTLFMTATEKITDKTNNSITYSMNDELIFGKYIDRKSVYWAIENKKITDYNVVVLKNKEEEVNKLINKLKIKVNNKDLFISCFMCLKSFEKYNDLTHILLYVNTTKEADLSKSYINKILLLNIILIPTEKIYNNSIHSKNCKNLSNEIDKFKHMPYGIVSCVFIFGEGFDLPKLNGVCIAGNMRSETRITQYLLRPNRLDFENPNKIAYVIIPYIDSDDYETENKSYEKVKNIISHMRNVDETVEHKIFLYTIKAQTNERIMVRKILVLDEYTFVENNNELNKIKLRLRYSKSLCSNFTEEQDEYNYIRSINISLNIQSKKEYIESINIHNNYIQFPVEYFKSKGVWNNWYDFMGTDTTKFIKDKNEWIKFCKKINIKTLDNYSTAYNIYDNLPKEPDEFYSNFTNILSELIVARNTRR